MIINIADLASTIDEIEWVFLRAHLERGGIIWVDANLSLADTALKVALDDIKTIQLWLETGMISKPTDTQIRLWDNEKEKKFSMVIISPYVLIQEKVPIYN